MFLVDERQCLARELANAEEDTRKLRSKVKTEQTSGKVIQRSLEAINAQRSFISPPNLKYFLFLPQGATTTTILTHFKTLSSLCHPDKGGREHLFKIILQAKNILGEEKARSIYDKYGIFELKYGPIKKILSQWNTHFIF